MEQNDWIEVLRDGKTTLTDFLDATERRYKELAQPPPPAFFLYIDQGEELYVRAEKQQRRRFSEVVATGLTDPRLRALTSLRADELQKDDALYAAHRQVNVAPLREAELYGIVSNPAKLLSARFEADTLAGDIARRTAEESAEDAGALPLLSYLLDDMWSVMVRRGDGVLRLPMQAIELGRVLVERANKFVAEHPASVYALRRILTLKLATVFEDSEPTPRRALRSEFSEADWKLVSKLADEPSRLLMTATPEVAETYAEVAHQAIFRRWDKLREWIAAEREFLAWRGGLDRDRRRWETAPAASREGALLMGLALWQAQSWLEKRGGDLSQALREFVLQSSEVESKRRDAVREQEVLRIRVEEELARLRAEQEAREQRQRADAAERARREAEIVATKARMREQRLRVIVGALVPIVLLLVHYVVVNWLDLDTSYLQLFAVVVPFVFGLSFFWVGGRGTATAMAVAVALGLISVAGMTVSTGLRYHQPIIPSGTLEWLENAEYFVSIVLSFVAGHLLGRVVLSRKLQSR